MTRRCTSLLVALLGAALVLAACGRSGDDRPATPPSAGETGRAAASPASSAAPFTVDVLLAAFAEAGLEADMRPSEGSSIYGSGARRADVLIGGRTVQVCVFPTEAVTEKAVAGVSENGSSISAVSRRGAFESFSIYEFVGPVHHFARGRLIVLYVEDAQRPPGEPLAARDARILGVLQRVMGRQFAGQSEPDIPHLEGFLTGASDSGR
jgi:hypothetical protein